MMTELNSELTIGQLVADNPGRARLFEQLGIDYCCGGKRTLAQACQARSLQPGEVIAMLRSLDETPTAAEVDAAAMTLAELADHIEATHHQYLRRELPRLGQMARKLAEVHGQSEPALLRLAEVFQAFQGELTNHMAKEEQILFPIIRRLEQSDGPVAFHCGSVANPIAVMEMEHDHAGGALSEMRQLTNDFTAPADGCNTWRAAVDGLRQLEANMHQHVHKENNILFPRAIELERKLAGHAGATA